MPRVQNPVSSHLKGQAQYSIKGNPVRRKGITAHMKVFVLVSALVALSAAKSVHKRNAYGDEPVAPAPAAEAPAPVAPAEQAPVAVEQPAADCNEAPAPAVPSGYRNKRNAYGDEPVAPAPAAEAPAPAAPEQPPVAVEQPSPDCAETPAPAVPSGYRSK
ncbi:unnamed protein product, partial [Strongylus vulgaris]